MSELPTVIVSTWSNGAAVIGGGEVRRAFAGSAVAGLASDGAGSACAIVGSNASTRSPPIRAVQASSRWPRPSACASATTAARAGASWRRDCTPATARPPRSAKTGSSCRPPPTPFADRGAVYRRRIDGDGPPEPLGAGLPGWLDGKADTGCIAVRGRTVAIVDWGGRLYGSHDEGDSWSIWADGLPAPSGVLIC